MRGIGLKEFLQRKKCDFIMLSMPSGTKINLERISESYKEFARLLTTGAVTYSLIILYSSFCD